MTTAGAARRRALVLRSIHRGGGVHLSEEWTSDPCGSRSTSVLRLPVVRGRRAQCLRYQRGWEGGDIGARHSR